MDNSKKKIELHTLIQEMPQLQKYQSQNLCAGYYRLFGTPGYMATPNHYS